MYERTHCKTKYAERFWSIIGNALIVMAGILWKSRKHDNPVDNLALCIGLLL